MVILTLQSCAQNKGNENYKSQIEKAMNYKYKTNKRTSYGIEYNTTLKCELWVNGIRIVRNYKVNQKSNAEIINDLLLGNGKHQFTMKFFPNATNAADSLITQEDMRWTKIKLVKAEVIPNSPYGETKNREELIDFKIPEIPTPVPYFEFTGEFEVNDLPYELEGWKNSQDLSKIDKDELKKEVVNYYKYIRNLLNEGNVKEFYENDSQRTTEIAIATYETHLIEKDEIENKEDLITNCKGRMYEIENYTVVLSSNNKCVFLVRSDKEFYNWHSMVYETEYKWAAVPIVIHKPKGSNSFKIIRK